MRWSRKKHRRLHSPIGCLTPDEVFAGKTGEDVQCRQGPPSLLAGSPDLRVPLKIHFYEIVNNTSQYDVFVQALLEYGDISSPEEFVTQRWPIPPVLATIVLTHLSVQLGYAHASMPAALVLADNRSCSCSVLDNFTSPKQFLEIPLTQNHLISFAKKIQVQRRRDIIKILIFRHCQVNARLLI